MSAEEGYRLFVNAERTVLVRLWPSGRVEVARRDDPDAIWGPPVLLEEETLPTLSLPRQRRGGC